MNGRPGALNHSAALQEFSQARYVQLRLQGLRRGGEAFADKRRAFYSIKEINVGGRCLCSGHAARCRHSVHHGVSERARVIAAWSVQIARSRRDFPHFTGEKPATDGDVFGGIPGERNSPGRSISFAAPPLAHSAESGRNKSVESAVNLSGLCPPTPLMAGSVSSFSSPLPFLSLPATKPQKPPGIKATPGSRTVRLLSEAPLASFLFPFPPLSLFRRYQRCGF